VIADTGDHRDVRRLAGPRAQAAFRQQAGDLDVGVLVEEVVDRGDDLRARLP
jgi:hypothetical protein